MTDQPEETTAALIFKQVEDPHKLACQCGPPLVFDDIVSDTPPSEGNLQKMSDWAESQGYKPTPLVWKEDDTP